MNIFELYNGAKQVSSKREYTKYSPENFIKDIQLDLKRGEVTFEILTKGSKTNEHYSSFLRFKTPILKKEAVEDTSSYIFVNFEGAEYYLPIIDKLSDVDIYCECSDYKFTFDWYNYQAMISAGVKPEPYESKGLRAPRNPEHLKGICKHIYQGFKLLQEEGYITK